MIPIYIESSKLVEIKKEFLENVNNLLVGNRIKIQEKRILEKEKIYDEINKELIGIGIKETLEEIILGDFDTLRKVKNQFEKMGQVYSVYKNGTNVKQKVDKNKCVKYSKYDRLYRKYDYLDKKWLIKKLSITVCPYCNREFINNRGSSTSAQLDHFYPRSKYPAFALSLFNLIPSCYACNHIKRETEISISPYDSNFNFNKEINFFYTPISSDYLNDHTKLTVDMNYSNEIAQNIRTMKIDLAYELHTDYVQELIKKALIYNKEQIIEFMQNYNGLFSTDEEIIRMIFGNYICTKDLGKRPLAKLTKDILAELRIYL